MYLHEAMEKLFRQVGRSMTTKEIAEKLNENKWYRKADGSLITPYQIYGRAKGYPACTDQRIGILPCMFRTDNQTVLREEKFLKRSC